MTDSNVFFPRDNRIVARSAEGCYVTVDDGRRLLDGIGGIHVVGIGYGVSEVIDAMTEQARTLPFVHLGAFTTEPQEALARKVAELAPDGMNRVALVTTGTLGIEYAVMIARYYHLARGEATRSLIISRWHSYHGRSASAQALTGSMFVNAEKMAPYSVRPARIQAPHCYHCPYNLSYPGCGLMCADELERVILQHGPQTISAFIAEPIGGGASSAITPPEGYYERIRAICDTYGILYIADEVITGFGRTGRAFGSEHWQATPDIIVATKGLSSGYAPIGAVIVHDRVWDTFVETGDRFVPTFTTYSGHPVSCAGALAALKYIEDHGLIARCAEMGDYLKAKLEGWARKQPLVGEVRGKGLLIGVEFVRDRETRAPFPRETRLIERIISAALDGGLIVRGRAGTGTGPDGDHLLISPPFIITREQCDDLVDMLSTAVARVAAQLAGGRLPAMPAAEV